MSSEGELFLTARHVPKCEPFLVIVGRGESLAIGTERHGIEAVAMPLDGAGILTADHVPEFDRLVVTVPPTGRGEGLTVGTERHGLNLAAVPIESGGPLAAGYVLELNLPVIVARGQHPAIRAKSHAVGACPSSSIDSVE